MRKSVTVILGFVLFLMSGNLAFAQNQGDERELPKVKQTYVTFKLHSEVMLTGKDGTQLPAKVTDFIDTQESLATLNVDLSNTNKSAYLRLSYVFPNMQSYRKWRSNTDTENFISYLKQNTQQQINMSISMVRTPLNDLVRYTNQK